MMTAALGGEGDERVVSEVADLWFHTMVLLSARGIPLRRVFEELARRHAEEGHVTGHALARALLALVLLAGCATATGRIENGMFYSAKGYRVTLPTDRLAGGCRASGPISRCAARRARAAWWWTRPARGRESTRPLDVLARHLTFGLTRRDVLENGTSTVGGREAAHSVVRGLADGRTVTVEALVMRAEPCVHDFLYVAPSDAFDGGAARVPGPGRELRAGAARGDRDEGSAAAPARDRAVVRRPRAAHHAGGPQPDPAAVLLLAGGPRDRHHRRAVARGRAHRRAVHRHGAGAADRGEHGPLRRRELRRARWWRSPSCASWGRC